jgi:hypothetical protein
MRESMMIKIEKGITYSREHVMLRREHVMLRKERMMFGREI